MKEIINSTHACHSQLPRKMKDCFINQFISVLRRVGLPKHQRPEETPAQTLTPPRDSPEQLPRPGPSLCRPHLPSSPSQTALSGYPCIGH